MSDGSDFHTAGPACGKVHFPNLVVDNLDVTSYTSFWLLVFQTHVSLACRVIKLFSKMWNVWENHIHSCAGGRDENDRCHRQARKQRCLFLWFLSARRETRWCHSQRCLQSDLDSATKREKLQVYQWHNVLSWHAQDDICHHDYWIISAIQLHSLPNHIQHQYKKPLTSITVVSKSFLLQPSIPCSRTSLEFITPQLTSTECNYQSLVMTFYTHSIWPSLCHRTERQFWHFRRL